MGRRAGEREESGKDREDEEDKAFRRPVRRGMFLALLGQARGGEAGQGQSRWMGSA